MNIFKPSIEQSYIKNTSTLVSILFILGGVIYKITNGYGTIAALVIALIIMIIKKILLNKANNYFSDMYQAKTMYEKTGNIKYLEFINLCIKKILKDINIYSEKAQKEISELQSFVEKNSIIK